MKKVLFFLLILFLSAGPMKGMDDFDPDFHWREMHYYAKSRSDWFKETCKTLTNESRDLKERFALAKKIIPGVNESEIPVPSSLSLKTQKVMQLKKGINGILSDLIFASLYWDFLERTLAFYINSNAEEGRKSVLLHFARELNNFDEFARGDLLQNLKSNYIGEEFFINRAIYEEVERLSWHYSIEIPKLALLVDQQTKEEINLQELRFSNMNFSATGSLEAASNQCPYFMSQLLNERRQQNSVRANENLPPDLFHPKMRGFQSYILPTSGPIFIQELEEEPTKTPKKTKNREIKKTSEPKTKPIRSTSPLQQDPVPPKPEPIPVAESPALPVFSPVIFVPEPIIPLKPQKVDLRDIPFHIEHRSLTSYTFRDRTYSLPLFHEKMTCFDLSFLKEIKRMIHTSPKTDRVPNLAKGSLTLHFQVEGRDAQVTIGFDELFVSGGKFFGREDFNFKKKHHLVNGMQDMLTEEEREYIYKLPFDKKWIPLGIALEKKLRRDVIGGPWRRNCLDSEALFLLRVRERLPQILKDIVKNGSVVLQGMVLGISSYRDACPDCQKLIQGFQWSLPYIISTIRVPNLVMDSNFATLALIFGHKRLLEDVNVKLIHKPASLTPKKNKLICIQSKE